MGILCSATTLSGRPCRAWSVHNTDPPLCSAHAGLNKGAGAPPGNRNRLTHGFYSRHYTLQEIADLLDLAEVPGLEDEITAARIAIRRLLAYLEENGRLPNRDFQAAIALVFTGTSTIGRLLRHQQILSGESADTISGGLATILNQLADDTGYDL